MNHFQLYQNPRAGALRQPGKPNVLVAVLGIAIAPGKVQYLVVDEDGSRPRLVSGEQVAINTNALVAVVR